ncbi:MAG: BRO family protein [Bilophila wadsworthia]|uniref:BRO-N domain-containing protein n=1 Tax=Bilophila wadsworthia TaxID=35833 RepID=UPI00300F083A
MAQSLCFNDFTFSPVIHDNQPWIPARQLANALGYKDERSVHKIYERNKDEFSSMMSTVVNLTTGVMELPTRIFSLRGCYALAMFARTPIAKAFRKSCLDVIERYGDRVPVERPISLPPSTPDDRKPLRDMVNVWARLSGVHPSNLWPQVRARFQLGRIDDLPTNWLPDTLAWVQSKIDELNQKPKAALPAVPQPTRQEQTATALERFRTFQREFFKVGSELEHCLRDVYWMPGNTMPDNLKPFANGMNYGIQSLFSATCHTMEAMERYASAHIAGEELMRRGAQ